MRLAHSGGIIPLKEDTNPYDTFCSSKRTGQIITSPKSTHTEEIIDIKVVVIIQQMILNVLL